MNCERGVNDIQTRVDMTSIRYERWSMSEGSDSINTPTHTICLFIITVSLDVVVRFVGNLQLKHTPKVSNTVWSLY